MKKYIKYPLALLLTLSLLVPLYSLPITAEAATCGFGTDIGGGVCRGYINAGTTSWTVPSDWNNANNKIEAIGCGGSSGGGVSYGGGGGAYAAITNLALTPGASIAVQVGVGGGAVVTQFRDSSTLVADYGRNGTPSAFGVGGTVANSIGTVKYRGGNTGSWVYEAPGGGGAAGPNGAGGNGGGGAGNSWGASFGGGGANGGANGASPTLAGTWPQTLGPPSGAGGNGGGGSGGGSAAPGGGGTSNTTPSNGGNGTAGTGGGGGGGGSGYDGGGVWVAGIGGNGASDTSFDSTHGSGGGGGGSGSRTTTGSNGANYGGGAGANSGTGSGTGGAGLIVITYTQPPIPGGPAKFKIIGGYFRIIGGMFRIR